MDVCDSSSLLANEQPTSFSSGSDSSPTASPQQSGSSLSAYSLSSRFAPPPETYSRKVFVGGLPSDIDQGEVYKLQLTCVLEDRILGP